MLRCVSRYRNVALGVFVEPGEVLRYLDPDTEALLQRDSPGSFEPFHETDQARKRRARELAKDAPSTGRMAAREKGTRDVSERAGAGAMSTRDSGATRG